VLHTWGRTLSYHPHVHFIVLGGAISEDGEEWLPSRVDFFVPVEAASLIYRAKFLELVTVTLSFVYVLLVAAQPLPVPHRPLCPHCGAELTFVRFLPVHEQRIVFSDTS
jgi:Putative transposase